MLIPRFSLRWMLGLTVACSFYFVLLALAVRGERWAVALSVAAGSLGLVALVHMGCFLLAWGLAKSTHLVRPKEIPQSPFATSRPPPQVLRPSEPD